MSYQKMIILGRLGQDPQVTTLESGTKVAQFSVAVSERGYKKKDGTEVPERTDWIPCVLWKGLAETAEKFLHKGHQVLVEGKLRVRSYDDKNGVRRTAYEVYADEMRMLGAPSGTGGANLPPEIDGVQNGAQRQKGTQYASQNAPQSRVDPATAAAAFAASGDNDDLPF